MANVKKIKHLWKKIAGKVVRSVSIAYMFHRFCFNPLFLLGFRSNFLFVCLFVFLVASLSLAGIEHLYT